MRESPLDGNGGNVAEKIIYLPLILHVRMFKTNAYYDELPIMKSEVTSVRAGTEYSTK